MTQHKKKKKVVTPHHTPTTSHGKSKPKGHTTGHTSTTTVDRDPNTLLRNMIASGAAPTGVLGNDSPVMSSAETWLRDNSVRIYTGARPGTNSTHKTAAGMLSNLAKMDPGSVKNLQQMLYAAGFYGNMKRTSIAWGDGTDAATREAYANALATAYQADSDRGGDVYGFNAFILDKAKYAAADLGGGGGSQRAPFSYQGPTDAEVSSAIEKVLPSVMGRSLNPDEMAATVADFQSQLLAAAKSRYAVEASGGIAQPEPDLQSFAEQRAKALHPEEADTWKKFALGSQVIGLLGLNQEVAR